MNRQFGAKVVPNVLNQENLDEVCSCLILANRWKFWVVGILSVLRLERGGTLNQRAVGSTPTRPTKPNFVRTVRYSSNAAHA